METRNNKESVFKIISVLMVSLIVIVFFGGFTSNAIEVGDKAEQETKIICSATIDEEFDDKSFLVVLQPSASRYRGIKESVRNKITKISNVLSIENISEYSEDIVNDDGTFNSNISQETAVHLASIKFKQVIKINLCKNGKQEVLNLIREVEKLVEVLCAEPNYYVSPASAPNDTQFQKQWALIGGTNGIKVEEAWNFSVGTRDVRVGVIDSGIALHDDLNDNVVAGYDFYNNDYETTDDVYDHGTPVAGIIGAVGNNDKGVSGVCQQVTLVPMQVYDETTDLMNTESRCRAIQYAINKWDTPDRISILNHSIGGFGTNIAVLAEVEKYQGLFVWSAGNQGENVDNFDNISGFNLPNLISVGAHDYNNQRSKWSEKSSSNYGSAVDIYAPGGGDSASVYDCITTSPTSPNTYEYYYGTSCAAPHVSGVAALLLSINPNLTAAQLKSAILNGAGSTTITLPDGTTQNVKKLDAFGAVKQVMSGASTGWLLNFNEHNLSQNVGEGSYFVDNNVMIKLVVRGAGNYKFNMSSTEPLNVTLYDSNLNATDITPTYSNENCTINLSQDLAFGTYYLRVNFADDADSGVINVTIPAHTHIYDDWKYYDHSSHISACKCGRTAFEKAPHTIRTSDIVNFHAPCLGCHYLLDLREDVVISPYGSGLLVSVNGSYICPSGVVVLVDEDVEAYFAGTLRFYDQDQLPQLG